MSVNRDVGQRVRRLKVNPSVAVVGLGYWGPNLARVLIERSDTELRLAKLQHVADDAERR